MGTQEQWVDARTLHRFLEVGKDFSNWIKDFIADFDFVEGRDFSPNLAKSTGGRSAIEYTITLDMGKELAMLQRSEKGKQARQYFIASEKKLKALQNHLLSGYNEVEELLIKCETKKQDGFNWYCVSQIRRLACKSHINASTMRRKAELFKNKIVKMPYKNMLAWWVREDAVNEILCVKPQSFISVAMVKLLNKGGA
jgi:phage anti-repressor protein